MLAINEAFTAYDLADVPKRDVGEFEIITPNGEKLIANFGRGHRLISLRLVGEEAIALPFTVRKVAEFIKWETPLAAA